MLGYHADMSASVPIAPCLEKPIKTPATAVKTKTVDEPIKPWITADKLAEINSKQRLMSWEEKRQQINRSLGRPLDSQ